VQGRDFHNLPHGDGKTCKHPQQGNNGYSWQDTSDEVVPDRQSLRREPAEWLSAEVFDVLGQFEEAGDNAPTV